MKTMYINVVPLQKMRVLEQEFVILQSARLGLWQPHGA